MKPTVQFTTGNFTLVIIGTVIMALGLYRMFPLQFNKSFLFLNGPLAVMLVIGIMLVHAECDSSLFLQWGKSTAITAGKFLPLMILLCMVMAIGGVITKIHEVEIQTFLIKHPVMGPFVAALVTPTSNALVPVVESAWRNPALQPMCLFYLQASVQMSVPLFMLRSIGFHEGSTIPIKMYATGFIVSIFMIVLMKPTFWATEALCQYSGSAWNTVQSSVRALW